MHLELPFPDKALWPNGRPHWATKHRAFQKHKAWARAATLAAMGRAKIEDRGQRFHLLATFYPKPKTTRAIDVDNAISSMKAFNDGIALALGVDDSRFDAPTILFGEIVPNGKVVILIGEATE
jgi:crossover junction endodeoxyribonuclease RusA